MKQIYTILLFIVLIVLPASSQSLEQELQKEWSVEHVFGSDIKIGVDNELKPLEGADKRGYSYGNFLTLQKDSTFYSNYTAWCGNDCFPSTSGKYELMDDDRIRFTLLSFSRFGDCQNISEVCNQDMGVYLLEPTEVGYTLKFDEKNEINKQLKKYGSILDKYTSLDRKTIIGGEDARFKWTDIVSSDRRESNTIDVDSLLVKMLKLTPGFEASKAKILLIRNHYRINLTILFEYENSLYTAFYIEIDRPIFAILKEPESID